MVRPLFWHCFEHARRTPQQPAVRQWPDGQWWTWDELSRAVVRAAGELRTQGVMPGDRVALSLRPGVDWVIGLLAIQLCQAIDAPIDHRLPALRKSEIAHRLAPVWWLGDESDEHFPADPSIRRMAVARPSRQAASRLSSSHSFVIDDVASDDCGTLLHTSGTTGEALAVMLSAAALAHSAEAKLQAVPQSSDSLRFSIASPAHAYARTCDYGTWLLSGCQMVICARDGDWLSGLAEVQPTHLNGPPSALDRLAAAIRTATTEGRDANVVCGSRLSWLGCGGAALSAQTFALFERFGIGVIPGYGLTEAGPCVCSATCHMPRLAESVGPPVAGMAIRIDRSGQLWCRGPGLMLGYYKQPQSTAGRLVDGWLATGDRARQLPDGSLVILGRCDEVQCLGNGYKFDPWPLEQRLQRCLSEGHVILFGSSRNHRPIAAVSTPDESFDDNALLAQFASELDDRPVWERPGTIARLPYPLKIETGELTAKGSVVRAAIARLLPSVSIQRRE